MAPDDPPRSDAIADSGLPDALRTDTQGTAARAVQYLLGRQSPGGGFCFYRWRSIEEPSLADTWHPLAALTLLGVEIPRRDQVNAFLSGIHVAGLDALYYHTLARECLGITMEQATLVSIATLDATRYLGNRKVPIGARLQRALPITRLQCKFAHLRHPDTIRESVSHLRGAGGWGEKPNLHDTWLALEILRACGLREFPDTTRRFINALQVAPFGFTATPDSNYADLAIVYAGLYACDLLRMSVRYPREAARFLLACQSGNGGFARNPEALPGIDLTHHGLLGLMAVGALPAADSRYPATGG